MGQKRSFLSVRDLGRNEIGAIFTLTDRLKGRRKDILKGKNLVLLFSKPSTRTRVSFEVAISQLRGNAIYLDITTSQMGRGETISDTAKVLSRYADGIIARLFSHKDMLGLAEHSGIPVINALDDMLHPCQALSDMYTIKEKLRGLGGLKLVFLGDGGSNVCHSLMYACSKLGINMVVSCPGRYSPDKNILEETGIRVVPDPKEAVRRAEILYTDVWTSMGEEREKAKRAGALRPYQLNSNILKLAKPNALVMHSLPAHRGQEITDNVMDGPRSIVFDQAENRLHTAKGILGFLLG
jgi:ornithine carbamoyltransferase